MISYEAPDGDLYQPERQDSDIAELSAFYDQHLECKTNSLNQRHLEGSGI